MNDMITLFNRLTSSGLADYNLFAEIVDNHYEKFKYLYYMIRNLDLNKLDTVVCGVDESAIEVRITSKENKYINDIIYTVNERKNSYKKSDLFVLNLSEESGSIIIDISMSDGFEEGDLYHADRFI